MQPPKKKTTSTITILKLKKDKITYTLALTSPTLTSIRTHLLEAINNSGGVPTQTEEEEFHDDEIIEDENDIPVPKSEFADGEETDALNDDDDDRKDVEEGDLKMEMKQDKVTGKIIGDIEQLRIAVPKNPQAPYDNEWIELTEENFDDVEFKDFTILAFAVRSRERSGETEYDDEEEDLFYIVEAAYEEL